MNRSTTLRLLAEHKNELTRRFGVSHLALFGSVARDAAHQGSDVDVLVAFDGPATSERYRVSIEISSWKGSRCPFVM